MMNEGANSHSGSSQIKYLLNVEQLKNSYQSTGPGNRMNHSMGYYNDQIFIFGGTSASNTRPDQHYLIVYWYSLENKQWNKKQFPNLMKNEEKERQREKDKQKESERSKQKQKDRNKQKDREKDKEKDKEKEKQKDKQRQKEKDKQKQKENEMEQKSESTYGTTSTRSFMASCQKQHKIYLFGGTNHRNQCNNELLIFDMKKCEWELSESIQSPEARQSAYLTSYMDNYLLLYGGIDLQKLEIYEHFYSYRIDTGVWRKIEEGNYRNILRPRYLTSLCSILNGEKIYLFGGQYRNAEGFHNFLSDFYEITVSSKKNGKIQGDVKNKGIAQQVLRIDCVLLKGCLANGEAIENSKYPEAKSAHKLLSLNDEYLVLVGGANYEYYYLSNVWVYSITNKIWRKIQFDFTIPKQAGIECCTSIKSENKIEPKESSAHKEKEIVIPKEREPKYLRQLKQYTSTRRKDRRQDNKQKQVEKQIEESGKDKQKNESEKNQKKYNTIFLYGGLNRYDSVRGDLFKLDFELINQQQCPEGSDHKTEKMDESSITQRKNVSKNPKYLQQIFYVEPLEKCSYCDFPREKVITSKAIVDSFSNMIPYPFNAIGLLLENAHNHSAIEFCVAYRNQILQGENAEPKKNEQTIRGTQRFESIKKKLQQHQENFYMKTQPFIHISENNQIQFLSYEQLKSSLKNFEYMLYFTYHNIEKKVRTSLQRQHQLHEYGTYLKVGSLRLGEEFIYLSRGISGEIRVFAYLLGQSNEQKEGEQNYYEFCSYVWEMEKKKIIEEPEKLKKIGTHHKVVSEEDISSREYYQRSYNRINKKYQKYLEDLFQNKVFDDKSNHLLIFRLKKLTETNTSYELFPHTDTVDICNSEYRGMLATHAPGIYQSIDLSMRAYMSCYFLKSEFPKMTIKVNNLTKPVAAQICLQSFDLMAKNRCIYEIDNSLINIEVKLMELYFNPVLSSSVISFHNGILFYHKGRLIARHGCPIGDLYRISNGRGYNFFHLFGMLEVPEPILPNMFRTEFIYNVMMQKLRSRLKFIEKMLLRQFKSQENQQAKNMTLASSSLLVQAISQEKTIKITKKVSQAKQKKDKKEDVQFNPNLKY